MELEFLRAPDDVRKPAGGERFDYHVYEYGHFDGEAELLCTRPASCSFG